MNIDDIKPGTLVKVPKGADIAHRKTYLLRVLTAQTYASGAVHLTGEVRRLDGSPSTLRIPWCQVTISPSRLEATTVRPGDVAPSVFGIAQVLRLAGWRRSVPSGGGFSAGFHIQEAGTAAVNVRHRPSLAPAETPLAETRAALALYAEAIEAAGWHVEVGSHDLTVTAEGGRLEQMNVRGEPDEPQLGRTPVPAQSDGRTRVASGGGEAEMEARAMSAAAGRAADPATAAGNCPGAGPR